MSPAQEYVLGGQGIREQLQSARKTLVRLGAESKECDATVAQAASRVAGLETRLRAQRRRDDLLVAISRLPMVQQKLAVAAGRFAECQGDREIANKEVLASQNEFSRAEETLHRKKDDLQTR